MSGANGQFNPNSGFENSANGMFQNTNDVKPTAVQAPSQPGKLAPRADAKKLRSYMRKGGIAALSVAGIAVVESFTDAPAGYDLSSAVVNASIATVAIGLPAFFMMRANVFAAAFSTFVALLNVIGVITLAGNYPPAISAFSIALNVLLFGLIARGTHASWKLRKLKKS